MAIQMRQGNEVDFDAEKMIPGEWAVSKDARIVRMCFAPGVVIRMATYEAFEADMGEIRDILSEAKTVQEAVQIIQSEINNSEIVVEQYSTMSKSYAVGGTGSREEEDTDNAKYYYDQAKRIAQGVNGIVPMGTITFEELPTEDIVNNAMYNISNAFTSDERFNDGGGVYYGAGNNVLWTANGKWDVTAASGVTGIKGENEIDYRQGNVNITRDNIGLGDDVFGTADISAIGDGTVKGAIKDIHYTKLLSNVSLFSINENGLYYVESPTDAPVGGGYSGYLRVTNYTGDISNYKVIEFTPYNFIGTYVNVCIGGMWKGWKKVAFADEFLPLTGGTMSAPILTDGGYAYLGGTVGYGTYVGNCPVANDITDASFLIIKNYTASEKKNALKFEYRHPDGDFAGNVFGEHNKPSGSYTGNGSATKRTISIGGLGSAVLIQATSGMMAIITSCGAMTGLTNNTVAFKRQVTISNKDGGDLIIESDFDVFNISGVTYYYRVL